MMFSSIVIFLVLLALISFCDLVSLPGNERKSMEQSLERGKKRHNMELSIVLPLAVILLDNRKTILCQTTTTPTIASLQHERVIQPWIYGAHGRARAFQISSQSNQLYVLMPVSSSFVFLAHKSPFCQFIDKTPLPTQYPPLFWLCILKQVELEEKLLISSQLL